ncbi:hypothetical protein DEI95_14915 [Curtobacterium sp. MCBD17_008]|nr:hypothetical protein DEI95_14915 [Curtobacterium sp. MCBD17_008]
MVLAGDAKVGAKLTAEPKGFTKPSSFSFTWAVDGVETDDDGPTYTIQEADLGKVVSVTVLNTLRDGSTESVSAASATVGADPAFATESSEDDPLVITTVAGERIDLDLTAAGSPAPTYELDWFSAEDAEWADEDEITPDEQLPDHTRFVDGHLLGAPRDAYPSTFKVTATNAFGSASQWVEIDVVAAAPAGVEVFAADEEAVENEPTEDTKAWLIEPNGKVQTFEFQSDPEFGGEVYGTLVPGGRPTIEQGRTLLVGGTPVDRFGNYVEFDEDGPFPATTVTSDVASDEIVSDSEFGDVGIRPTEVSTHHITVSQGAAPTTFALDVTAAPAEGTTPPVATPPVSAPPVLTQPAAAPIGTVPVRTAAHGRLAYTGTDSTDALPWALAMLAAGAALVGLRTVRRRARR